jgi:hypothetical protein
MFDDGGLILEALQKGIDEAMSQARLLTPRVLYSSNPTLSPILLCPSPDGRVAARTVETIRDFHRMLSGRGHRARGVIGRNPHSK